MAFDSAESVPDGADIAGVSDGVADGVAIVVKEGASVTLEFPDGNMRTLDLRAGAMVLWGIDSDYVLRPEQD